MLRGTRPRSACRALLSCEMYHSHGSRSLKSPELVLFIDPFNLNLQQPLDSMSVTALLCKSALWIISVQSRPYCSCSLCMSWSARWTSHECSPQRAKVLRVADPRRQAQWRLLHGNGAGEGECAPARLRESMCASESRAEREIHATVSPFGACCSAQQL